MIGLDEAMEEIVQPITLHAAAEREEIGAVEFLRSLKVMCHARAMRLDSGGRQRRRLVLVDRGGDASH